MPPYLLLFGMRPFSSSFPILTASQFPSLPSYSVSTTLKISPLVNAKLCGDSFSHSKWLLMKNESPLPQAMMSLQTETGTSLQFTFFFFLTLERKIKLSSQRTVLKAFPSNQKNAQPQPSHPLPYTHIIKTVLYLYMHSPCSSEGRRYLHLPKAKGSYGTSILQQAVSPNRKAKGFTRSSVHQ